MNEDSETELETVEETPADAPLQAGDAPFDGIDVPHTGDERVDEVLAGLLDLAGAPVADHVAIYDTVHRGLRDCLADLEHAR
ncbi:MAG: hypothetical protein ACT4QG_05020 [Sporichthyaceae bacterium]